MSSIYPIIIISIKKIPPSFQTTRVDSNNVSIYITQQTFNLLKAICMNIRSYDIHHAFKISSNLHFTNIATLSATACCLTNNKFDNIKPFNMGSHYVVKSAVIFMWTCLIFSVLKLPKCSDNCKSIIPREIEIGNDLYCNPTCNIAIWYM